MFLNLLILNQSILSKTISTELGKIYRKGEFTAVECFVQSLAAEGWPQLTAWLSCCSARYFWVPNYWAWTWKTTNRTAWKIPPTSDIFLITNNLCLEFPEHPPCVSSWGGKGVTLTKEHPLQVENKGLRRAKLCFSSPMVPLHSCFQKIIICVIISSLDHRLQGVEMVGKKVREGIGDQSSLSSTEFEIYPSDKKLIEIFWAKESHGAFHISGRLTWNEADRGKKGGWDGLQTVASGRLLQEESLHLELLPHPPQELS